MCGDVSRPYRRCLVWFMWLFHHCIMLYGQNYPKIGQSWSWCSRSSSRSRYKFMVKILILYVHCVLCIMCGDVSRPYQRCLVWFTWLFHHCIMFYGQNYPKIRQSWSWCSRSRYKFMVKMLILHVHCVLCIMCGDVSTVDYIRGV